MLWVSKRLAFKPSHGDFPHAPGSREGHRQGEALPPELQELPQCPDGGSHDHFRQHHHPHEEPGEED